MSKKSETILDQVLEYKSLSQCKLCMELGRRHVPPVGNRHALVMIIGQSPGDTEVIEKRPFVGPAGELLDFMLDEAGLMRDEVFISNLLKCQPPKNRVSKSQEATNCINKWLKWEILAVNPKLILILGGDAHSKLLPKEMEFRHLALNKGKNRTYLSCYHPSYFLRRGEISEFVSVGGIVRDLLDKIEKTL